MGHESIETTRNFNCTIQELKRSQSNKLQATHHYFNCTIQELKLTNDQTNSVFRALFQLHHTGIKTIYSSADRKNRKGISIAQYRN